MSGIIDIPGARSGRVSTTQLEYEEGTWTLTATYSGNNSGTTPNNNTGKKYSRIGNNVTVQAYWGWTNPTGTVTAADTQVIKGFPYDFSDQSYGYFSAAVAWWYNNANVITTNSLTYVSPNSADPFFQFQTHHVNGSPTIQGCGQAFCFTHHANDNITNTIAITG